MKYEEAASLMSSFTKIKTGVELVELLSEAEGEYALHIVRVDEHEEIFTDASAAAGALACAARDELVHESLYAILGPDRIPILCDFNTWNEWNRSLPQVLCNRVEKIKCPLGVEATLYFTGRCSPELCMDGRPKFWDLSFIDRKNNRHYYCPAHAFESLDEARAFVAEWTRENWSSSDSLSA